MEDPKKVAKSEPRKSLFILLLAGIYSFILGIIIQFVPLGSGDSGMAEGVSWIFIVVGLLSIGGYVGARRQRKTSRH